MKKTFWTIAAGLVAATGMSVAPASASDNPLGPTPPDLVAGADRAAEKANANGLLTEFDVSMKKAQKKSAAPAAKSSMRKTASAVPVFMLSPDFVKGKSGQVGQFGYAATTYQIGDAVATVDGVREGNQWVAANVASGDTERRMSVAAKGSPILHEPQVNAWYAVRGSTLFALNDTARGSIGGSSITVAKYQKLVQSRYAAMMPGTSYDKAGYAGGYAAGPTQDAGSPVSLYAGAGAGFAGLLGAGYLLKRRRNEV